MKRPDLLNIMSELGSTEESILHCCMSPSRLGPLIQLVDCIEHWETCAFDRGELSNFMPNRVATFLKKETEDRVSSTLEKLHV